ncbi:MAG: ABC transporter ATP-binding protein [Gemmatimonadetes bacterium]|nr:ABC transporter ATP-binding protein [Gemmatimonadota bacterium]NNM06183.1 ABC transporter ATP-binding protein [Gemmatimonadota bacterium]
MEPVIHTHDLTRYYGSTVGVEGLTLEIQPGEIFGFLGPNGAGKTTTIRLLLDLIRPTRGESFLFGCPSSDPLIRSRIGYLPGELSLDGRMTGGQTLTFLAALRGDRSDTGAVRATLCQRLGLNDGDLKRKVREYSRGMKQKLGLVSALQHRPRLLILDEPTTGLDPLVREVVFQLMAEVRDQGVTVFHSSHVLSEVDRTCDRVGVLREGRLVSLMTMDEARRSSSRHMVVVFKGAPPLEELQSIGADVETTDGSRVVVRVTGELGPLLSLLAENPVEHFSFPEPNLEEAFTTFYSDGQGDE